MNIRHKLISLFITGFVPIFPFLLQVIKILQKTNVTLNFAAFTLSDNVYNFDTEIHRCINDLIRTEDYTSALKLSNVAGFNSSEIILAQVLSYFLYKYKFSPLIF